MGANFTPNSPGALQLTGCASTVGITIGLFRGSRKAGLQYLAEHAHNAPTSVRGWYLYKKEKNNRMILGGLRQGARDGFKLAAFAGGWVAVEELLDRAGLEAWREPGAGLAVAAAVSAACASSGIVNSHCSTVRSDRLPFLRLAILGVGGGVCMLGLRMLVPVPVPASEPRSGSGSM